MLNFVLPVSSGGTDARRPLHRSTCSTVAHLKVRQFRLSEPGEPTGEDSSLQIDKLQRLKLRRLLQNKKFQDTVAMDARCGFVKYTGILFNRCEFTEEYNQGLLPQYQKYETNVNYTIVEVPPVFLELANIPSSRHRTCAVFERFGLSMEELTIEQEITTAALVEEEKQYERWADQGEAWRTETSFNSPDGARLYEEDFLSIEYE